MTNSELTFLKILKSSIHPENSLSAEDIDWDKVISLANKQNLLPLIFDAAQTLPGYEKVESNYFNSVANQLSLQLQRTTDFLSLYNSFAEKGIYPIVLKGIVCRELYGERSELRPSCDEDILIEKKDYEHVTSVLQQNGFVTDNHPDSGLDYVQEITYRHPDSSLSVELHLNPFGCGDSIRTEMNSWFIHVFDSDEIINIENTPIRTLKPTDHFLFLIFHAFKHFVYGGFGVRLMLDILLFAEKYYSRINWGYIHSGLNAVDADAFYNDLVSLGNAYLGFQLPISVETCPDALLEDMFSMGTFGNTTRTDHAAALFTADAVQRNFKSKNYVPGKSVRVVSFLQRLFPTFDTWLSWKPSLADKPWMLPVEWVRRLIRYLRGQGNMGSTKEINESYMIAERRLELLKKYGVI